MSFSAKAGAEAGVVGGARVPAMGLVGVVVFSPELDRLAEG